METALITGASNGIGLELAKIFASHKINLVLVARKKDRLLEIADNLSQKGIEVRTYDRDLSQLQNAEDIYKDLADKQIRIDYLVNNAGFGTSGNYTDLPWESELNMLNLNMVALAYFTKVYSKEMKQNGKGRILNIASTAAFQPGPYMAAYSATKSFVLSLSEAVHQELKGSGVSVSALCPGPTETNFKKRAGINNSFAFSGLSQSQPRQVAQYGYNLMMKGKRLGIYGNTNRLIVFALRFICRGWIVSLAGRFLKDKS